MDISHFIGDDCPPNGHRNEYDSTTPLSEEQASKFWDAISERPYKITDDAFVNYNIDRTLEFRGILSEPLRDWKIEMENYIAEASIVRETGNNYYHLKTSDRIKRFLRRNLGLLLIIAFIMGAISRRIVEGFSS